MHRIVEQTFSDDILRVTADTRCGIVHLCMLREDAEHCGTEERLANVINARIENAVRRRLAQRTDAEWLTETVNADG